MGKVIRYNNKSTRGQGTTASDNPASAPPTASPKAKRRGRHKDAVQSWSKDDLDQLRQLLNRLMREKQFAQANIVAKQLIGLNPDDVDAWHFRGAALLELDDLEQAEFCLRKSMSFVDYKGHGSFQMSRVRLFQGDLDGALHWCDRAIQADPEEPFLRWHLIGIHKIRGDLQAAIAVGRDLVTKTVGTTDEVRDRLTLANLCLLTTATGEAEEHLQAALKLDDQNPEIWSALGRCFSRQNKTEDALKAFRRAAEIDPRDPNHLYSIADACLGLGQPDKAIKPLLQVTQLTDDYRFAHYKLSLSYFSLKKYREAEISCRAALSGNMEMDFPGSNLGMAATEDLGLVLLNQDKLEEAEACFQRNLKCFVHTSFNLGLTLFRMRRYGEAFDHFRRAVELAPGDAKCHNLLGQTHEKLGRAAEAEQSMRRAIELDERYAIGYYDLGVFLARQEGRKAEALSAFEQALKNDPEMAHACYGIACLHTVTGEEEEALAMLGEALRKGFQDIAHIEADSDWDGLRANPKFTLLLRKYRKAGEPAACSPPPPAGHNGQGDT